MSAFDPKRTFVVGDAPCRLPELYVTFGDRLNVLPPIDLGAWISEIGMRMHRSRSSLGNPSVV
jgi:hypothetical protein